MGEFVAIMLSIIFFLTPKEINEVQVRPYATDTDAHLRELTLNIRKTENGWCFDFVEPNPTRCLVVTNGQWLDRNGKLVMDIKNNLKVTQGTNYIFKPKDWDNPLEFSVGDNNDEKIFQIKAEGKTV